MLKLHGNYVLVAQCIYPENQISAYHGPVLIVHGDADEAVPIEVSYKAAKQYENCQLVVIEYDTHCFDYHLDQMELAVCTFMENLTL